jgi:hypothetical protein
LGKNQEKKNLRISPLSYNMTFINFHTSLRRSLTFLTALFFLLQTTLSQTPQKITITGKPIAEIFTDFHVNLNDSVQTTGFGLNRAYFGYNFLPGNNFSSTIILNIGSPEDLPVSSVHRRYAYVREASVSYSKDRLHLSFGITGTRHFDYGQKFWGKRYVANTFQALNHYGVVADLGIVADYKFSDLISADITVMNGEGYSELQLDNGVKSSAGITITPSDHIALRVYNDINKQYGIWQYTFLSFAGFRNERITIGAEANYKTNIDLKEGHNGWGITCTGALALTEKYEVFARYDYSGSVTTSEDTDDWNYLLNGNFVIAGFQYTISPNVKLALDYQDTVPYDNDIPSSSLIFLNASFKF